jgi:dihydroneopterin aldolase
MFLLFTGVPLSRLDTITLKNMQFYSKSGLYPFERETGQPLEVDVTCSLDLRAAGRDDRYSETIDYVMIYEKIKAVVLERRYNLLEAICERIAGSLLEDERIRRVFVRCRKPKVRLPGILEYAEVAIEREQQ